MGLSFSDRITVTAMCVLQELLPTHTLVHPTSLNAAATRVASGLKSCPLGVHTSLAMAATHDAT